MTTTTLPQQQEAVLRLLDTRMACLLVDRPSTEVLRRNLFALREKLARDRLDPKTLRKVEVTVRALAPRRTIDGAPLTLPPEDDAWFARPAGWRHDLMGRAVSGAVGLSSLALLLAQLAV